MTPANEKIEIKRVKAAYMRRIDQVPRASEDGYAKLQGSTGHQNAMAFAQPCLRHQMKMFEHVQREDFLATLARPRPGQHIQVMHHFDMRRMLPPIVMHIAGFGRLPASEFKLHRP